MISVTTLIYVAAAVFVGIFLLILLLNSFYIVKEKNEGVLQTFGKHKQMCSAGFGVKWPFVSSIVARISLRIRQLEFEIETKTDDNVFVEIVVAVQLRAVDAYKAFYELSDPEEQIESYVNGVLRGEVPRMKLDNVFDDKDKLEIAVRTALGEKLEKCGYEIENVIIKEIDPDDQVKSEMNRIEAAKRALEATRKEAEAKRVEIEEEAQARANAKKFEGEGLASQQIAIARGRSEAIQLVKEKLGECDDEEIAQFLLESNRIEGAVDMAKSAGSVVLMPFSPPGANSIREQMIQANLVKQAQTKAAEAAKAAEASTSSPQE